MAGRCPLDWIPVERNVEPLREKARISQVHGSGQDVAWEVYIVRATNGALYTGIARDADRRFEDHANGRGAKFFRVSEARDLIFREKHESRGEAQRREAAIKRMRRAEKLALIAKGQRRRRRKRT